ncbi:hypothetical protein DH2020_033251 [Rehmannia glutinosa]|uniref:DUF1995 domain-containing protein n=1 Tax=Rehmannia glutinosa TaxID=99300 RepID=A0ABR0VEY2_REHGL
MASKLLQIPAQTIKTSNPLYNFKKTTLSLSFSFSTQHLDENQKLKSRIPHLSPKCTLSMSSPKPPTTKEEAILQAKTSLSYTLEKPLNNPKLAGKLKKIKQPRFRVEIPVIDDSPSSLSQLALNQDLTMAAIEAFDSRSTDILVQNIDISSVLDEDIGTVNSADVAVFLAPEASQIAVIKTVSDSLYPRPVVIFNPKWGFEEEIDFGEMSGFVGSFEVVYSFMGLEVRGILSKKKGVVFKCVRDGVLSGEKWNVFVEEEEGELRVVSRFKARPSITEVENVLYNLMAINSPVTKSAKFLKDLVSNVTGKKK